MHMLPQEVCTFLRATHNLPVGVISRVIRYLEILYTVVGPCTTIAP